jgi:hypothetical protein
MTKQLFVIESPLQLLNAYEAMHQFPAQLQEVFVRFSNNKYVDQQIRDTIDKLGINQLANITYLTLPVNGKSILDGLKMLLLKIKFLFQSKSFQHIFIGEYESRFIRFIIPYKRNIILLDDGSKTLGTQDKFTSNHYFDWFTIFEFKALQGQNIYQNTYNHLHKHLIFNSITDNNTILFIGSNLSEEGVISEEYNISLLKKVADRYSDKRIRYIAHRRESDSKLDLIKKIENIKVSRLNYPIELLSVFEDYSLHSIVSFYSTALITLKKIYGTPTIAFQFDYSNHPEAKEIDAVYNYCKQHITVIKENDI